MLGVADTLVDGGPFLRCGELQSSAKPVDASGLGVSLTRREVEVLELLGQARTVERMEAASALIPS